MDQDEETSYILKWHEHKSTLTQGWAKMQVNGDLTDCTILTESKSLKAHTFILSACSPFFKSVLADRTDTKEPVIILKDVKYQEVLGLLDYMYKGEVTLPRCQVREFIKTAHYLQIKGFEHPFPILCDSPPPMIPLESKSTVSPESSSLSVNILGTETESSWVPYAIPGPSTSARTQQPVNLMIQLSPPGSSTSGQQPFVFQMPEIPATSQKEVKIKSQKARK